MQIREVKTGSKSIAVQVIYYKNRKRVIFKHVGSGKTTEQIIELRLIAEEQAKINIINFQKMKLFLLPP